MIWIFSLSLFLLLSGFVCFNGMFHWNGLDELYASRSVLTRGIIMLFLILCMGFLWISCKKVVQILSSKTIFYTSLLGFVFLFSFQIIFLLHEPSLLRYDALKVFDEALSMLKDGSLSNQVFDGYFSRYTNNYAITIFAYLILKLSQTLGLLSTNYQNALFLLQLVNTLFVDLSFFIGFWMIRSFFKPEYSLLYVLFLITCPLSYVWLPFFYTNSISMPFLMTTLYLFLELLVHQNQNPILLLALGLLIPIGFYLRATQVIVCIAAFVFFMLSKRRFLKPRSVLFLLALGMFLSFMGFHKLSDTYTTYDKDAAFPTTHWIAMGLNETSGGTFDTLDEAYTRSFPTAQEKKQADLLLIKERLHSLGGYGVLKLYLHKLDLTFSEGTGGYPTELSISDSYDNWYQNVYGNNRYFLQYYCQLTYLLALLFCMIGSLCLLFDKTKYGSVSFCIYLTLLGAFLFQMLWEAGNIYSTGYTCFLYVGFAMGLSLLPERFSIEIKNKAHSTCLALFLLTILSLCFVFYDYKQYQPDRKVWLSVNQYLFLADTYEACTEDMTLVQTFTADRPIDEIYIQAENKMGDQNDSIYQFQLCDESGSPLSQTNLSARDVVSYGLTKLPLSYESDSSHSYQLKIKKLSGTDCLSFLYYDTGNYDAYKLGELSGLKNGQKPDLCFIVLQILQ